MSFSDNPLRDRDLRPEFKGKLLTSTEPLDNDERLLLFRMNKAFEEFFNHGTDQVIEEEQS